MYYSLLQFFRLGLSTSNPLVKMSGSKKRKVNSECRVFNKEWTAKYFFTEVRSKAVCLIYQETVVVFKEYNISHHFATKHANYTNKQSTQGRAAAIQRLMANLETRKNFLPWQTAFQETSTKGGFMLTFKLAKASNPSPKKFVKQALHTHALLPVRG